MSLQGADINKTAHAELKFVPCRTPIAVSLTLKTYIDEGIKIGEQVTCIPGIILVSGVLDGTGEDGTEVGFTGTTKVLDTGDIVRSGHAVNRERQA